jgi:hypothetical protein
MRPYEEGHQDLLTYKVSIEFNVFLLKAEKCSVINGNVLTISFCSKKVFPSTPNCMHPHLETMIMETGVHGGAEH